MPLQNMKAEASAQMGLPSSVISEIGNASPPIAPYRTALWTTNAPHPATIAYLMIWGVIVYYIIRYEN